MSFIIMKSVVALGVSLTPCHSVSPGLKLVFVPIVDQQTWLSDELPASDIKSSHVYNYVFFSHIGLLVLLPASQDY